MEEDDIKRIIIFLILVFLMGIGIGYAIRDNKKEIKQEETRIVKTIKAEITAYTARKEETDDTPCVGAGGYICNRDDVVACPREIPLGTWIEIDGKKYQCMDRMNKKYEDRFDLFMGSDLVSAIAYGKQTKEITILE